MEGVDMGRDVVRAMRLGDTPSVCKTGDGSYFARIGGDGRYKKLSGYVFLFDEQLDGGNGEQVFSVPFNSRGLADPEGKGPNVDVPFVYDADCPIDDLHLNARANAQLMLSGSVGWDGRDANTRYLHREARLRFALRAAREALRYAYECVFPPRQREDGSAEHLFSKFDELEKHVTKASPREPSAAPTHAESIKAAATSS